MDTEHLARAKQKLSITTEELQEIMLYAHQAYCGTALQLRDVLRELRSTSEELEKLKPFIPTP